MRCFSDDECHVKNVKYANFMKVWAYVIAWNEELMLPYYLRHYSTFCDKIIVYDNMSTDSTRMIAESYGDLVEVVPFDSGEEFNDYVHI